MRHLVVALVTAGLLASLPDAHANGNDAPPTADLQITRPNTKQPNEADLKEHGHYLNKKGITVHSPAHSQSGAVPTGASAQCRDSTYSFSQTHRGTCSHHGGVAQWLN
jgi:hypothetical protein